MAWTGPHKYTSCRAPSVNLGGPGTPAAASSQAEGLHTPRRQGVGAGTWPQPPPPPPRYPEVASVDRGGDRPEGSESLGRHRSTNRSVAEDMAGAAMTRAHNGRALPKSLGLSHNGYAQIGATQHAAGVKRRALLLGALEVERLQPGADPWRGQAAREACSASEHKGSSGEDRLLRSGGESLPRSADIGIGIVPRPGLLLGGE